MTERSCSLSPYLTVKDAAAAIDFYRAAFNAEEQFRLTGPDGRIGHAELRIGGATVMLSDEWPDFGALSPPSSAAHRSSCISMSTIATRWWPRAVAAGATLMRPVADQFYGDRSGMVTDPFGHSWFVATLKDQVSPTEMQRRWDAAMSGAAGAA